MRLVRAYGRRTAHMNAGTVFFAGLAELLFRAICAVIGLLAFATLILGVTGLVLFAFGMWSDFPPFEAVPRR
jgi:hypothetical protein